MKFNIPYYKGSVDIEIDKRRINGIMVANEAISDTPEIDIVKTAMYNPIGSKKLSDLAVGKKSVLIIASDHTRPVPSRIIMPILLEEVRKKNASIDVKIIIATGFHRGTTIEELVYKFGDDIVCNEEIIIHDSFNADNMVHKGSLPSGTPLYLNKAIDEADLVIAEGFIEPHFFAGFSGGRKSVLPGIAFHKTVFANHCSGFLASSYARCGNLKNNPLHIDMIAAAQKAKLTFILNVILDDKKKITHAFAGDTFTAHEEGCRVVSEASGVKVIKADVIVTSNGGYPLDQNMYQAVKGLTTGEACVNEHGVIIMFASCIDGHGGQSFFDTFAEHSNAEEIMSMILSTSSEDTIPDQWESQMLAKVQIKANIIIVSTHVDPKLIRDMKMMHAYTFDEALAIADNILGIKSSITVIPDGVKVIALPMLD